MLQRHYLTTLTRALILTFRLVPGFFILAAITVYAEEATDTPASTNEALVIITVATPYLELRSGPARGYPVIRTLKYGDIFSVAERKTRWYKIQHFNKKNASSEQGWIDQEQMETTTVAGKRLKIHSANLYEFNQKKTEFGFAYGQSRSGSTNSDVSNTDPLISLYGGYHITQNLSAELTFNQLFGQYATSLSHQANLTHEMFPEWVVSPLLSFGVGSITIDPKETLGGTKPSKKDTVNYGIGFKYYITKRFFLRSDINKTLLLSQNNAIDKVDTWKIGLSVFF